MTAGVTIAISLLVGVLFWGAVRLGIPLSNKPMLHWGLHIGQRELVRRCLWASIVALAAVPVFFGLAQSPAYLQMLIPMLAGLGLAENMVTRWEKRKRAKSRRPGKH